MELSDRARADVAMRATHGTAGQQIDDLDDAAHLDAERAVDSSKGTGLDGAGLLVVCGRCVAREPDYTAGPIRTSARTVGIREDSGTACCNGASASRAINEQARCTSTGPTSDRVPKVNIRWSPAETTPAATDSR